jgi:hypothetical protein
VNQHFFLDEEEVRLALQLMEIGLRDIPDLTPGERGIAKAVVHRFERAVNPRPDEEEPNNLP